MSKVNRREFLKVLGVGTSTIGAASIFGAAPAFAGDWRTGGVDQGDGSDATPEPWQQIDIEHEEKVDMYMEHIGGDDIFWDRPIEFTMDGDVKVFELTVTKGEWETESGNPRPAYMYNGMVPGPTLRATEGERVRIVVHNEMDESTAIHWHGIDLPNDQDGVTYLNQLPILPGETFTYEFDLINYGSHMYHSHHNSLAQVVGGLLGAFIIDPADSRDEPEYDKEYVFILNDSFLGFTINGRSFPYTQPMTATVGERIRVRFMNEGLMPHPMHLHGMPMRVFAKDGYNLPAPYLCDTLNVAPGERYDVIIEARAPGAWAFHCHVLSHVENAQGMFGMVTALVIAEAEAADEG